MASVLVVLINAKDHSRLARRMHWYKKDDGLLTSATNTASSDFDQNIIFPKLWERNLDD